MCYSSGDTFVGGDFTAHTYGGILRTEERGGRIGPRDEKESRGREGEGDDEY